MPKKSPDRLASLTAGDISAAIQMAWEDRTAFETIKERIGITEAEVIRLMRSELTPNSFQMWRKRMKGRTTKHRELRSPDMKFDDLAIADHRRANCQALTKPEIDLTEDVRCCGTDHCMINAEGQCWCGQQWDGEKMCFPNAADFTDNKSQSTNDSSGRDD